MSDPVRFVKAEANGNDFLIVDAAAVPPGERSRFARAACDRHRGVGADGVEFVRVAAGASGGFDLDLYNADGGSAEVSGNGTRCVAAFYAQRGFHAGTLRTGAGPVQASVVDGENQFWNIELTMGVPAIEALESEATLQVGGRAVPLTVLSMGNPQCVVRVSEFAPDWEALGTAMASHPRFPHGTNVEFMRVADRHHVELRIVERGVGPTHSSGTGSCAAAAAAIANGWCDSPILVKTPGGSQRVAWPGGGAAIKLTGPARVVAEGMFFFLRS